MRGVFFHKRSSSHQKKEWTRRVVARLKRRHGWVCNFSFVCGTLVFVLALSVDNLAHVNAV